MMTLREVARASLLSSITIAAIACTSGDATTRRPNERLAATTPNFTPVPIGSVTEPLGGWLDASCPVDPELIERVLRGYHKGRSPDVMFIPRTPNFVGGFVGTGHSGPWDYLQEVPLVFYGPGFIRPVGEISTPEPATVADIVPTLAELLDVDAGDVDGRVLEEVLVPEPSRPGRPRLIVTIAWDGGGTNVLDTWPGHWPNLRSLMQRGASMQGAIVGSSPSITPATHTTMGTGVFPATHGAVGISLRENGEILDSFAGHSADDVEVPMLGDTFDLTTNNEAKIGLLAYKGWHLGMMSHGTDFPGGDEDIAVFVDEEEKLVTGRHYSIPAYLDQIGGLDDAVREIDLTDGERDDTWRGHEILADPTLRRDTPVWVLHQTKLIKELLRRERFGADDVPDLFFTNYKQIDEAGHTWNMLSPEVADVVRYSDEGLRELETFLDATVGEKQWVMVITADHGQQPAAEASRGWPISVRELIADIADHFGIEESSLATSQVGVYMLPGAAGITPEEVSDFVIDYRIRDNLDADRDIEIPESYRSRYDEPVMSAAFPARSSRRVLACARSR
ncbi:MAG: alkaline phosphatase family protein [Actinomycetota bacterium]